MFIFFAFLYLIVKKKISNKKIERVFPIHDKKFFYRSILKSLYILFGLILMFNKSLLCFIYLIACKCIKMRIP